MNDEVFGILPARLHAFTAREFSQDGADVPRCLAALQSFKMTRVAGRERAGSNGTGIGMLPILGPLWHPGHWTALQSDFSALMADPGVSRIALFIDSPGGVITGVGELANQIYQARSYKPIEAHIFGLGASAAYWVASAASRITIGATGEAGSIGVHAIALDTTAALERAGIKRIDVISSQSPRKNLPPTSDAGCAALQQRVDAVADVMVRSIAQHRGVSPQTVLERFGRGDLLVGRAAVNAGLVDTVANFGQVLGGTVSADAHQGRTDRAGTWAATIDRMNRRLRM
jgi:capsid assembly protease